MTFTVDFRRRETPALPTGFSAAPTPGVEVQPSLDTADKLPALTDDGKTSSRPYGSAGYAEREYGNDFNLHPQLRQEITRYAEGVIEVSSSGGTLAVDVGQGNIWKITLSRTATLVFTTPPAIPTGQPTRPRSFDLVLVVQRAAGASITWPASVKWPGGSAPTMDTEASSLDRFVLQTLDNGVTWLGNDAGLGFA